MKKNLFFIMILAAAVGCSRGDKGGGAKGGEPREIRLGAVVADVSASTRAAYDRGDAIEGITFLRFDGNNMPPNIGQYYFYHATDGSSAGEDAYVRFRLPMLYDEERRNTYLWAYCPPLGGTGTVHLEFVVDGKTDIMLSEQIYDVGRIDIPIVPVMRMKHILAQLEVVCAVEPGLEDEVRARWGKIEYIKFNAPGDVCTYMRIERSDPALTPEVVDRYYVPFWQADYETEFEPIEIPASGNTAVNAAAMVFPNDDPTFWLLVKTENYEQEYKVVLSMGKKIEVQKKHTIMLSFNENGIKATTTIEDWGEGNKVNSDFR